MAKKSEEQSSVTFQLSETRKIEIEELAHRLGLRRIVDGKERGNTSAILNLIIQYLVENKNLFAAWVSARIAGDK